MTSFANPDGSFTNENGGGPVTVVNPGTAVTETYHMGWNERSVFVNNTSTLTTTLDLFLPKKVTPGDKVEINAIGNLGTVAITDGFGNAISGAPATLTAGAAVVMRYVNSSLGWKHWK